MATEIATSHQTPSEHEPIEKVTEELKPVEPEIVSVAKKTEEEEENLKPNELASQSTPLSKSEGQFEDKEAEPPTVEVKMIDDAPIVDVPVDDEKELVKDPIPDPHISSVLAPVTSAVNGKSVAPAIEFVPKEAEEQPSSSSLEELPHEEPNTVDVPVSLEEAVEKPREPPEVLIIKESEPIVAKDTEDSGVLKEVDKPELVIPEDEVKLQEQSEAGKHVEKPKTVEVIEKPEEPLEVLPIKSEALVVKDADDSEPVFKEDDKPELVITEMEVKLEDQSEVIKKVETEEKSVEVIAKTLELVEVLPTKESEEVLVKDIDGSQELSKAADKVEAEAVAPETREVKLESEVTEQVEKTEEQSVEANEKTQDSSEVHPVKESEVAVKDIDDSVAVPEVDKPEPAIPEVEVKQEEQSEVIEQVEKTEPAVPQVEVKLVEQPEVTEQVEKPESSGPEVEVKPEEQPEVTTHAGKQTKHEVELKTEAQSEVSEQVEIKPTNVKPEEVAVITQEAKVDVKEDIGKSSLPEVGGKVGPENEKKEAEGIDLVEVLVKEVMVEAEKGGEEKEAQTTKDEGENIASETLKEEVVHPIKVEDVSDAASSAEVTEKSFEGEKTVENVEPAVEDKKEEIPAGEGTEKDQSIEGKLVVATKIGCETVKESQDSGLEANEEESAKTNKENSEQGKVDEIAKSYSQNLEPSTTKDAEDTRVSLDLPRKVPAKPSQKHSNNILTKVKQSLVKAKKAIIGKSPTPKTVSSDTKGDAEVNN